MTDFEIGREHYLRKEYKDAIKWFTSGAGKGSCSCMNWLGHCYEYGLDTEKDLVKAKDLYTGSFNKLCTSEQKEKSGIWLQERLETLKDIPLRSSDSRFISGIGNVRVVRSKYSFIPSKIRFNKNEAVADIEYRESLTEGFAYAERTLKEMYSEWTCDGINKFYDGYVLKTDFFTLKVQYKDVSDYMSIIDDRNLTIYVPEAVSFDYLYVQIYILKKAKDLLIKRAETVIPLKLKEVADRIGTTFKKCEIVPSNRTWLARNNYRGSKIEFCAKAIQLPEKSLEALCVHELTHNFISGHGPSFHKKMIELGGEEYHKLDRYLFHEGKWPYLKI